MNVPINTRGLISHVNTTQPAPSGVQNTQPTQPPVPTSSITGPLAPGSISRDPNTLRHWDTARPILRFDFQTPQEQATFHRAFSQIHTPKDKADFISRFFDNYDGQVQIPRRVIMDTSRDEEVAKRVQEILPPVLDTARDEVVAREVQGRLGVVMETERDEEMARRLQERTPLPRTDRDEDIARRMQERLSGRDDARRRNEALSDEAIARRMQQQLDREDQAHGYGVGRNGTGNVDHTAGRFGGLSFDGRGPAYGSAGQGGPSGYERRRPGGYAQTLPQSYGREQQQGFEGGNGYTMGPRAGGNTGYGHPAPGQHHYGYEEGGDFEQHFGNGRRGYGPRYGGRGYR
jgi:hypothetical protein